MQNTSYLELSNGDIIHGISIGYPESISGEVVFNTGMVGYYESLSDPSYHGQILVFTYPLIGNYGVPASINHNPQYSFFESERIQASGVIVSDNSYNHSHWSAAQSFNEWLVDNQIPALMGIDTRQLTKTLRKYGTMLGRIIINGNSIPYFDPNQINLIPAVSIKQPAHYNAGPKTVILIDCGCKNGILRSLLERNLSVIKVPWDYDFAHFDFDGIVISNGPGDPQKCAEVAFNLTQYLNMDFPILGICLGNQFLAHAAGATTYKLPFGHRGQNQPCVELQSQRCFITSQNHGFAVKEGSLKNGWQPWFINANDGTIEGICHRIKPFFGVQFHPEASPGPLDTKFIFDMFADLL